MNPDCNFCDYEDCPIKPNQNKVFCGKYFADKRTYQACPGLNAMKPTILQALETIERLDDVKILYACESGSRAWGFESEDSDWDVRFVYCRKISRYLSLTGQDSTIDRNTGLGLDVRELIRDIAEEHDVDLAGWDLKKTFEQVARGNPVLSEWFGSPIVYVAVKPFSDMLKYRAEMFYKNKAGIYHYEHMARRNFNKYIKIDGNEVITKKYLYILRPIWAMAWLDMKGTPPPMRLREILGDIDVTDSMPGELYQFTLDIIDRKRGGEELGTGPREIVIDTCIEEQLDQFRAMAEEMSVGNRGGLELSNLDPMFYEIVMKVNEMGRG